MNIRGRCVAKQKDVVENLLGQRKKDRRLKVLLLYSNTPLMIEVFRSSLRQRVAHYRETQNTPNKQDITSVISAPPSP